MRNLLLCLVLLCTSLTASAQLSTRYVMAASFSSVTEQTGTTHQATLDFQSDQLGNGYLGNQVQVGYRVLTSTKRQYSITSISNTTFSSATVVLTEIGSTTLGPNGTAVVYEYDGTSDWIPVVPANSTGMSQALLATVLDHNFAVIGGGGLATVSTAAPITGDGTSGSPITYTRPTPTWAELSGKPAGFADGVDDVNDADNVIGNEDNPFVLDGGRYYTTKPDGTKIGSGVAVPTQGASAYNVLNSGDGLVVIISYFADNAQNIPVPTLTGTASGGYDLTLASTASVEHIEVIGSSTTSNASGELVLRLNEALQRLYNVQLYDGSNNQKVDLHLTGNVPKQVQASGTTTSGQPINGTNTLSVPNIGGNYPSNFRLILN